MTAAPRTALDAKRNAPRIIVLLCAAISLGLMLWVGRHNHSVLLILMFVVWVTSPFAGLIWILRAAIHWGEGRRRAADLHTGLISVATVAVYAAVAFILHLSKPAGPFLVVPALTWLVIATLLARGISKSGTTRN